MPHGHADGQNVDHQQVQDAADHRHMGRQVFNVVHDQHHVGLACERALAGRDGQHGGAALAGGVGHRQQLVDAAAAADDDDHVGRPQHIRRQHLQPRFSHAAARHAEAQELELRVVGHHTIVADGVELDALGAGQQVNGAHQGVAVELVAQLQDGAGGVGEHLHAQLQHAVFARHLRVRQRHGGRQARGQAQLEVAQAHATQAAAEADHGRLADQGGARDGGDGVAQRRARVRQDVVSHAPLSGRQAVARALDLAQDGRAVVGMQAAQLRRQDCRSTSESGVFCRDDVGRDALEVVAEATLVFEAGAEQRAVEIRTQPQHDAAADVDAAQGAQRHRQVGRGRAQHGAEGFQGFHADGIAAVECAARNFRGRQRFRRQPCAQPQRAVDEFDAGA